jgi:hypothetical protein
MINFVRAAQIDVADFSGTILFPPLVKGGVGGVGTRSPDSPSLSPSLGSESRQSVRRPNKRLKMTAPFRRKKGARDPGLASPPPPVPPSKGGERKRSARWGSATRTTETSPPASTIFQQPTLPPLHTGGKEDVACDKNQRLATGLTLQIGNLK